MRVTDRILTQTVLQNFNRNLEGLKKIQDQMSSGKAVSRPSDDPIAVARILGLKSAQSHQEQYDRNMQDAIGWLDTSEAILGGVTDVLQRMRELVVYGGSDTMPDDSRRAIAAEVDQLIDQLVQVFNTNYGGRYIFGGFKPATPPFSRVNSQPDGDRVVFQGTIDALEWETAQGIAVTVNADLKEVLGINDEGDSAVGLFQSLMDIMEDLKTGEGGSYLQNQALGDLDGFIDAFLSVRASLGARSNRLRLAQEASFQSGLALRSTLAKLEDVDLAESVMNFKMQETAYQAALSTAAMTLQPTLLDYLR